LNPPDLSLLAQAFTLPWSAYVGQRSLDKRAQSGRGIEGREASPIFSVARPRGFYKTETTVQHKHVLG
jgi:hypothetical protein